MKRGEIVNLLINVHNHVLYIGVTSNLTDRIQEHKRKKYHPNL